MLSQYCDNFMEPRRGGAAVISMKVGCGFVEKSIHGQRYLYVWTYQVRGAGIRRVEKYMGPSKSPEARGRALRELDAYAERATAELNRRRARWHRLLSTP